ncbi:MULTISPECIES: MBL fold metallo-hydrolase [unclassified Luteococcus]|uniref:MBL fold metallo-hydrolase n=1 Tax=unclassified Luteococcus TaxID=2639923 RepID=UPI00313D7C1A
MREFSLGDWQLVRDDVYVAPLEPASVNAGLVIGRDGVLLVDTGSSPAQGRELAASAHRLAGRPVTHVVVTHAHFDHFYGLAGVLAEAPDAVSIGHENLLAHLEGTHDPDVDPEVIRRDLGFDPAELVAPGHTISFLHAIDLGSRVVELVHLGPGHSDSDLFVQVPDARITFVGDMVETSSDPMVGPDSHVDSWPQALDGVLKNAREDALFIPGHGPVASLQQVTDQRANISKLWAAAEDCIKNGMTIDDVVADLNGPREVDWPFAPQSVANALPWLYQSLQVKGVTKSTLLPIIT